MKRFVAAWWFLFLLSAGILVAWEMAPHGRDDVEICLLPACFLLLSAWALVVRHQSLAARLASLRFDRLHPPRTDQKDDSDAFRHLFDGY
jgi:hypothetical protein